jgi:putative aldouronate transport system substrate-binding protein
MNKPALTRRTFIGAATLGLAAACSSSGGSSAGSASGGFSYELPDEYFQWIKDDKWYPALTAAGHATINLVDGGPRANYYEKVDLALTSNSIRDAAIVDISQVTVYGPQGAFIDLKPLIDKYAPNIKRYIASNPDYEKLITIDGKIYFLVAGYPRISYVTFYRADMFEKAGITEVPRTISAFTDALRKLKKAYSGTQNYYPLLGRPNSISDTTSSFIATLQYAFNAQDGITDGKIHGIYYNGLGNDIHSPGFKTMLQWYRTIYEEGLIDPEFVAGTITENEWQSKMLGGKGAVSTDFFTRPSWFMNAGGTSSDPDFLLKVMPAFQSEQGAQLKCPADPQFKTDECFAISTNSGRAEDIIKFLDFTFSPRGQQIMHYGVQGKSYRLRGGTPEYMVTATKESNQPVGTPVWNFDQDRLTFPCPFTGCREFVSVRGGERW